MTTPVFETLGVELRGSVAVLTLNRLDAMNAINLQMRAELREAFDRLGRDTAIGAAVLTGAGSKAFSAGMDLREFAKLNAELSTAELRRVRWGQGEGIGTFEKPLIAAVNGLAVGGGVELALLCDVCLAADAASFAFGEVKRGLIPGNGGTQRLARRVGTGRALDIILTGRTVPGRRGACDRVWSKASCRPPELLARSVALAEQMAANAPLAVRAAKAAIQRGAQMPLEQGLRLEQDLASLLYTTDDAKEGPCAFLEKRPPVWQGR